MMLLYHSVQLCREINELTGFGIGIMPYRSGDDYQLISRYDPMSNQMRDEHVTLLPARVGVQRVQEYLRNARDHVLLRKAAIEELNLNPSFAGVKLVGY
jgi:hypothetical protein